MTAKKCTKKRDARAKLLFWLLNLLLLWSSRCRRRRRMLRSLLSNNDGDVNENGKKAIGLDCNTRNARSSRFFVHFIDVTVRVCTQATARLRRENA